MLLFGIGIISCDKESINTKDSDEEGAYSLTFEVDSFALQEIEVNGEVISVRAYENIVYVGNPVDTNYQIMNIYIPAEYFDGQSRGNYTAETAPIFFPNNIGGYMPANPGTLTNTGGGGGAPGDSLPGGGPMEMEGFRVNTSALAISKGYIVASPGARGRTTQNNEGEYTGKAPAAIVDLKAAVRYLKYNDQNMPGNAEKIISNGTSAGGALSALLGATGNSAEYEAYLDDLGAANATDDVFAVSAFCPITNLDHADMAYEWQFNDDTDKLDSSQVEVSNQLSASFPSYINSLGLTSDGNALQLDEQGNGSFKTLVKSYVMASAQKALDGGTDLSSYEWITLSGSQVSDIDYDAYLSYLGRMKSPPAFDALDLSTGENQLFGNDAIDCRHFTDFSYNNSEVGGPKADNSVVKLMNPMYFIGVNGVTVSSNWRIRHGTKDSDTSLGISVLLATLLKNNGYNVDFELSWNQPHGGDYNLDDMFFWIEEACK